MGLLHTKAELSLSPKKRIFSVLHHSRKEKPSKKGLPNQRVRHENDVRSKGLTNLSPLYPLPGLDAKKQDPLLILPKEGKKHFASQQKICLRFLTSKKNNKHKKKAKPFQGCYMLSENFCFVLNIVLLETKKSLLCFVNLSKTIFILDYLFC